MRGEKVENIDFTEVFVASKGGHERAKERLRHWRGRGYKVIPYEDEGVSVGIYVTRKGD